MGIKKDEIRHSDRCYDIFILAVKEYDLRTNKSNVTKLIQNEEVWKCQRKYEKIKPLLMNL